MEQFGDFIIPKEALEKIKDPLFLKREIDEGKSLQEIFGYNEETMEKFYEAVSRLFQEGKYRESANAFVFLTLLNPYVVNYWIGLGMSEQMLQEYETALTAYAMALVLDQKNPIPYFHSANCLFAIGEDSRAIASLELMIELVGDQPVHQELKAQAQAMVQKRKGN